jgi:NAD(P)-dependent dehydrogenase (short-subunit alcohol dehydrogenase family)
MNGYATGSEVVTRSLALGLAPVRVNAIRPGAVEIPLWAEMPQAMRDGVSQQYASNSTTGTMEKVKDVAEEYLYVMKEHNITGTGISTNSDIVLK